MKCPPKMCHFKNLWYYLDGRCDYDDAPDPLASKDHDVARATWTVPLSAIQDAESVTPRTDHVLQHGLAMTGKDELLYLCKTLERELAAANEMLDQCNSKFIVELESLLTAEQGNVNELQDSFEDATTSLEKQDAQIAELRAKLAAAEKDALRYRWLRNTGDETWTPLIRRASPISRMEAYIDEAIIRCKESTK